MFMMESNHVITLSFLVLSVVIKSTYGPITYLQRLKYNNRNAKEIIYSHIYTPENVVCNK